MDVVRLKEYYDLGRECIELEAYRQKILNDARDMKSGTELRARCEVEAAVVTVKIEPLKVRWKELRAAYDVGDNRVQRVLNTVVQKLTSEEIEALVAVLSEEYRRV